MINNKNYSCCKCTLTVITMLTCKKCKQEKDKSMFYKSARTRNGYRGSCKACCNAQVKAKRDLSTRGQPKNTKPIPLPTKERLNELYTYRDGLLFRNKAAGSAKAGAEVGYKHNTGYIRLSISHNHYLAHRVIWKMHHGSEPSIIDHINGNKHDNRIENLRETTRSENGSNQIGHAGSETGFCGVYLNKWKNKSPSYVAQVRKDSIDYPVGRFGGNLKAAVLAYNKKAKEIHGEFADRKIAHNTNKLKDMGLI